MSYAVMVNYFVLICLSVIITCTQAMPTNQTDSNHEKNDHDTGNTMFYRALDDQVQRITHHIKRLGVEYYQIIKNGQCEVEYDGQLYAQGSVIKIRKKLFQVDECLLERVFHACGPKLLLMLSVVCRVVEQHKASNEIFNFKRAIIDPVAGFGSTSIKTKRVIAESCCENFCNISELTRYCH